MKSYFAYGSNMWDAQMMARCPDSRKLGHARLPGFRWIISTRGYANVVESPEDEVEGVLFEISESDERSLDRHEGVASGKYRKAELSVLHAGQAVNALVYVDPITTEGHARQEYITRINAALGDAGLSDAYIARQVRRFIPA
jgi:cation transport regulator ChaC